MAPPVFPTPPGLAWSVKRTPEWDTVKHDSISGKRIRFPNRTYPLRHYELTINVLRSSPVFNEWQSFEGFFNSVQGAFGVFYYDDPNDDNVANQGFGIGDGVTTSFQLVRALGGFAEPVFITNGNPSSITVGGSPAGSFTISPYGVVTFASAPALNAALQWTGAYYWPCQFDDDTMTFENFMLQLFRTRTVKFSTMKLP